MSQVESGSEHTASDMVKNNIPPSFAENISPQKIGKAGKFARITLAASLALNSANLTDIEKIPLNSGNERFELTSTNIGAGPNFGIQFPEIKPELDPTKFGAFYYGHRAMDSVSPGITDWYRAFSRRAVGAKGERFYEEQYGPDDDRRIEEDIEQMMYGNIDFAITSWDSINDARDQFMKHLKTLYGDPNWPYKNFSWSFIYEKEGYGDPSEEEINNDLNHMEEQFFSQPWFLKNEKGEPVLFVYSSEWDREGYLNKWAKTSKERGIEVVLKSYHGYEFFSNPNVDDVKWYDYQPAHPIINNRDSVMIAPQYIREGDSRKHTYHPKKWEESVSEMVASGKEYGLIISWNERYEHTGVKPQKMNTDECPTDGNYPLDISILDTLRKHLPPNPYSHEEAQTVIVEFPPHIPFIQKKAA